MHKHDVEIEFKNLAADAQQLNKQLQRDFAEMQRLKHMVSSPALTHAEYQCAALFEDDAPIFLQVTTPLRETAQ